MDLSHYLTIVTLPIYVSVSIFKKFNKSIEKHEKNIAKLIKQQSGVFVNETKKQQLQ